MAEFLGAGWGLHGLNLPLVPKEGASRLSYLLTQMQAQGEERGVRPKIRRQKVQIPYYTGQR